MGLSASQARLLNLTSRMHDIEYRAQNLEAQKLQMSNESTQVYKDYEDALNKKKVQLKQIGTDGSATYKDASFKDVYDAGYCLKVRNVDTGVWTFISKGNMTTDKTNPPSFSDSLANVAISAALFGVDTTNSKTESVGSDSVTAYAPKQRIKDLTSATFSSLMEEGYIVLVKENTSGSGMVEHEQQLSGVFGEGYANFSTVSDVSSSAVSSKTGYYDESNIATDTNFQEISDETDLKKAEAKYEADMRKINAKDKKFDTDLAAMETERNAVKTEMETLKTVAKDNVDRTFKLFS